MSAITGVESLTLLPDRFEAAGFTAEEAEVILGESADRELSQDNFNWLGAYLVEQTGLYENEVTEWFKSSAGGLGRRSPIDVWSSLEGFEKVFNYAKNYKGLVDEALVGEEPEADNPLVRSHNLAHSALTTISKGFKVAGVALVPEQDTGWTTSHAIGNPEESSSPIVRWKGNGVLEDYRITRIEGERTSMYYIVRHLPKGMTPMILQSGVVESFRGKDVPTSSDSDINGRAPSASEIATFVVPLASEIKKQTLSLLTR